MCKFALQFHTANATIRLKLSLPSFDNTLSSCPVTYVRQVSTILGRATPHALVILDEFGKGSLTSDGVGLLAAVLRHYAGQPSPPLLLACTHFSELLQPGEQRSACQALGIVQWTMG